MKLSAYFRQPNAARQPRYHRLLVETLEARDLLSTFLVDRLTDLGQGSGRAGDLRYCITNAASGDTITFGVTGTINLTGPLPGLTRSIAIEGPGADLLTIRRDTGGDYRIFVITPASTSVTISGLTIANGHVTGDGGAIFNQGTLDLSDSRFSGNSISNPSGLARGGAIYSTGTLAVTDSTFSANSASGYNPYGGAVYSSGGLTLDNDTFSGDSTMASASGGTAGGGGGGAVYAEQQVTVRNSVFSGNSSQGTDSSFGNGGGLELGTGLAPTTATITGSVFSGNQARSWGGAIANSGDVTISGSTLSNNTAGRGGAINDGSSFYRVALTLTDCAVTGNQSAADGGGISDSNRAGPITIDQSVISGNVASTSGGGVSFGGNNSTIMNSTVSGNRADTGGGIFGSAFRLVNSTVAQNTANTAGGIQLGFYNDVTMRNTIVAGNTGLRTSPDMAGTLGSSAYNLVGNTQGASGFGATDLLNVDPLLGPLQDNGGPTFTQALLPGSPALNAGDPAQLGSTDQRGVVRRGGVNIGAYQASASAFVVTAPDTAEAGVSFDVTVAVVDDFGQLAFGYRGTATFTSADPYGASLPDDYAFITPDRGVHTFPGGATLYTAGDWDVTATDRAGGITGSTTVVITPAAAVQFVIDAPAQAASGMPFDITVTAVDPYGNTDTNYQGTVTLSTTDPDPGVMLPADYSFTADDGGAHTFPEGVTLITPGDQTITVADTAAGTITGSTIVTIGDTDPRAGRAAGSKTRIRATFSYPRIDTLSDPGTPERR